MAKFAHDMEAFQNEVLREYRALKSFRELQSGFLKHADVESSKVWRSRIDRFFFNFALAMGKKAFREGERRFEKAELELNTSNLLKNTEIQEIICIALCERFSQTTFDDEQAVSIITKCLWDESERGNNSIELDAELFSFFSYSLLSMGMNEYCSKNIQ